AKRRTLCVSAMPLTGGTVSATTPPQPASPRHVPGGAPPPPSACPTTMPLMFTLPGATTGTQSASATEASATAPSARPPPPTLTPVLGFMAPLRSASRLLRLELDLDRRGDRRAGDGRRGDVARLYGDGVGAGLDADAAGGGVAPARHVGQRRVADA